MTDSKKTLDEKCWKGYKKKGMKTMFGKRYPNCVKVKKEGFSDWRSELEQIEEKTKLKNTDYGPAVVYQKDEKTVPARVRQQMPTGGDGTAYMGEKMDLKKADMGDVITDFRKSDAPQFKGKSDKKIQKMAIAAKLTAMEALDSEDVPVIKGIVKKLEGASKKHKNQAVALKKAVDENVMLTYRSGQGFDAKLGGKSVRNTVKNIKTGVDAVKNIKNEKGIVKGIKKTINDKKTTNTKTDVSTNVDDAIKNFKMKEDTAIESELTIQDWNVDDIKFTEVEAVDIIKPEPLKPSPSNWRMDIDEDWQKVNRKDKTDGLSQKAVNAYRKENPGSKLKTAVTKDPKKLKKGSKSAKRRLSFCRRMKGMKKKLTSAKTRRDPDSRINKALRRWNC